MTTGSQQSIAIVGGGLVGSLAGLFCQRRRIPAAIYERRPDPGPGRAPEGRSINLVVTSRGLNALDRVGLREKVLELTVAVTGRVIHSLDGAQAYQPYGRDDSECNYSVSRGGLNRYLQQQAVSRGVPLHFDRSLRTFDLDTGRLELALADGSSVETRAGVLLGADGAGSVVRQELIRQGACRENVELLRFGYKELLIPAGPNGESLIEKNALHIWPRGEQMLMALPNLDGSFTVTLYLPMQGANGFESLREDTDVRRLFGELFADSVPLIPGLERQFHENPTGELGTVRCAPWHQRDRVLLIGDAAHAIVPFFGQGMNTGFEDCQVLDDLLELHGPDQLETVFASFDELRKPDADAIADMALDNFVEMRDRVGDKTFLLRKRVEHRLEQELPGEYRSRYSMVMYSSIPFQLAQKAGRIQERILAELCHELDSVDQLDMAQARRRIAEQLTPFLVANGIRLDY